MPVRNLAVEPVTADLDTSVEQLSKTMEEEQLGDLVIVEDGKPVGIVTDRDIALAVGRHAGVGTLSAEDVMTPDPVTIPEDAGDVDLPAKMAEGKVRRLPVVDADGNLTGIVTLDDLVATIGEELADVATVIEAQSPEYSPE